jgi:hypothetical protein
MRRREFLVGCAAAALCSLGAGPTTCEGPSDPNAPVEPNRDGFLLLTGESFRVLDEEQRLVYAELVALEDGPVAAGLDQYVLRFRTQHADSLPSGLYEFYHTRTGAFYARIEPTHMDESGVLYASLFNQML